MLETETFNSGYADGPGTPRYNGMVSAMSWRTGETMAASDSKRKH